MSKNGLRISKVALLREKESLKKYSRLLVLYDLLILYSTLEMLEKYCFHERGARLVLNASKFQKGYKKQGMTEEY